MGLKWEGLSQLKKTGSIKFEPQDKNVGPDLHNFLVAGKDT